MSDEIQDEVVEEPTLAEKHVAFKRNVMDVLNRYADQRFLCSAYEDAMERVGLAGRPKYYDGTLQPRRPGGVVVVGEQTETAFEDWKRRAQLALHLAAERAGLNDDYIRAMKEAGFEMPFKDVTIEITGTFTIRRSVKVLDGEDVVRADDHEFAGEVREQVWEDWFGDDVVNWKAVVIDPATGKPLPEPEPIQDRDEIQAD